MSISAVRLGFEDPVAKGRDTGIVFSGCGINDVVSIFAGERIWNRANQMPMLDSIAHQTKADERNAGAGLCRTDEISRRFEEQIGAHFHIVVTYSLEPA